MSHTPSASTAWRCREKALIVKLTHPEPHVAYMAGVRYEYLYNRPCVHLILHYELMRRAEEQWAMLNYLRRKASDILEKDAQEALGPIIYECVEEFLHLSNRQLEAMLE